jgi:methionyl-tRNA formyltransferase
MRAIILTSNSLRHKYYAQELSKKFHIVGIISEPKVNYYTKAKEESEIVREHFKSLSRCEEEFFKDASFPENIELLELAKSDMNNAEVVEWAKKHNPDVIFLFGTVILKDNWLNAFENKIINLHLGLSPFYRGSATLFWPIYNNELECLGVTIHLATKKVDAGQILGRVKPDFEVGDNYYTINYKAIKKGVDSMGEIVQNYLDNNIKLIDQNLTESKLYKKADFTEETLLQALDNIGEGLSEKRVKKIQESKLCNCYQ